MDNLQQPHSLPGPLRCSANRGRGRSLGVSCSQGAVRGLAGKGVQQHRVGISSRFSRGWAPRKAVQRIGTPRVLSLGWGWGMDDTCLEGWARCEEGLSARASAPYRRWEARSWAPNVGRGWTLGRSAPRAAATAATAAAGKEKSEVARGPSGAVQPRPASLAPPGCWVG